MRIKITKPGIHVAPSDKNPSGELAVGTELDIKNHDEEKDCPHPWAGRFEIISGGSASKGKTAVTGDTKPKYEAVAREGGSFSITDGDKDLVKGVSKADAESFNKMSDKDKAEYVAAATKK